MRLWREGLSEREIAEALALAIGAVVPMSANFAMQGSTFPIVALRAARLRWRHDADGATTVDRVCGVQEQWSAVDEYVAGLLASDDAALEAAHSASEAAGLPAIQVSPPQGKLLYLLAGSLEAKTILEFGTLGAYSTIWLGRALPEDGRLITLEADPGYAEVARKNIARAGLNGVVDLRVGPALDVLPELHGEGVGPFDFTFIDADKENSPAYFAWALEHSRPGSLIVADNVVRAGTLADAGSDDPKVLAQRRLHEMVATENRVSATTIQTVGSKGYDGFIIALVKERSA